MCSESLSWGRDNRVAGEQLREAVLREQVEALQASLLIKDPDLETVVKTKDLCEEVLMYLYTQHPDCHEDRETEEFLLMSGRVCATVNTWFALNSQRDDIKEAARLRVGCTGFDRWVISNEDRVRGGGLVEILTNDVMFSPDRREWISPEPVWQVLREPEVGYYHVSTKTLIEAACSGSLSDIPLDERCRALEMLNG